MRKNRDFPAKSTWTLLKFQWLWNNKVYLSQTVTASLDCQSTFVDGPARTNMNPLWLTVAILKIGRIATTQQHIAAECHWHFTVLIKQYITNVTTKISAVFRCPTTSQITFIIELYLITFTTWDAIRLSDWWHAAGCDSYDDKIHNVWTVTIITDVP